MTTVKENQILFKGEMVRALLAGTKTQTRRIVKPQPGSARALVMDDVQSHALVYDANINDPDHLDIRGDIKCPYGQPGDRLWVRETSRAVELPGGIDGLCYVADNQFRPIEDSQEAMEQWLSMYHYRKLRGATVPPIHMPRWASRILLEIVSVRVEKLRDISEADARAEGYGGFMDFYQLLSNEDKEACDLMNEDVDDYAKRKGINYPIEWYHMLWDEINGYGAFYKNPWVWVVEFKRIEP
jgi:hypothetical protein